MNLANKKNQILMGIPTDHSPNVDKMPADEIIVEKINRQNE